MNMLLHRQKRRRLTDGTFIKIGEDGSPYATDKMIVVADGLGGRGGFPHTKVNPDIFNRELFYRDFIEPVVGKSDEEYIGFTENCFKELFETKDKYFSDNGARRTSGYFASRLVTAIVLHALKFDEKFGRDVILENIGKKDGDERKRYIESVCKGLEDIILRQLTDIANRMGLELESKTIGSYLLPTTLAVTLTDETDDGVTALYLWAGDSRGYLWDKDGLAQITDDHETDETMTNLISLTKQFRLEARLLKTSKPAILFNATDGCYKCPCFTSPFDMEYVILQSVVNSDNWEGASSCLDEQFALIGAHDDSNTIALTTFGFGSFDEVKAAANERLDYLGKTVVNELPGILDRNYEEELVCIDKQTESEFISVKDELIKTKPIADFVKQSMTEAKYAPLTEELNPLRRKLDDLDKEKQTQKEKIAEWVRYYWLRSPCLKKMTKASANLSKGDSYKKFSEAEKICKEAKKRNDEKFRNAFKDLSEKFDKIIGERERISDIEAAEDKTFSSEFSRDIKSLGGLLNKIDEWGVKGNNKDRKKYSVNDRKIKSSTERYTKQDEEVIKEFVDRIYSGKREIFNSEMSADCRREIEDCLTELQEITKRSQDVSAETEKLKDKYMPAYWESNMRALIVDIYRNHPELIPEEIQNRDFAENIGELQKKREEIKDCLNTRSRLYENYSKGYYRYFKESAL